MPNLLFKSLTDSNPHALLTKILLFNFSVFSTLLGLHFTLSILFFSQHHMTCKHFKKHCYINLTNWLDSRFFHYTFPFSQSHLVWNMRISWRINHLNFVSVAKSALYSHFPYWQLLENRKIIVSKPFVHSKFDKSI